MNQLKHQRRLSRRPIVRGAGMALGLLGFAGCSHGPGSAPMNSSAFLPPNAQANDGPSGGVSEPAGPVTNDNPPTGPTQASTPKIDVMPPPGELPDIRPIPKLDATPASYADPVSVPPPVLAPPVSATPVSANPMSGAPAARSLGVASPADPAARPAGSSVPSPGSGVYMSVGGVMVQVGQTPIYASQVLAVLDKEFAVRSRDLDPDEFKYFARREILSQLHEQIENEKYFTIAQKALGPDDLKMAMAIAESMRHDRLAAVGGSEQLARKKCADDGTDFDQQLTQDYRSLVLEVYEHRHVDPLIQVSADDMREFYRQNVDKLYTQKEKIQFRVIEVEPEAVGGDNPTALAADKIRGLREKALRGDDFAQLASTENDDAYLKSTGGAVGIDGWMDRNGYSVTPVDQAVWKLDPGQVTDVINYRGNFYIAKVEQKKIAHVRPFEEQAVQDEIYNRLYKQQSMTVRSQLLDGADEDSMVTPAGPEIEARIDMAVDMAMQKYCRR